MLSRNCRRLANLIARLKHTSFKIIMGTAQTREQACNSSGCFNREKLPIDYLITISKMAMTLDAVLITYYSFTHSKFLRSTRLPVKRCLQPPSVPANHTPGQPYSISYASGAGGCDSSTACGCFICASISIGTRTMPGGMPCAPISVPATLLMGRCNRPCCCKAAAISVTNLTFWSLRRRFVSTQAHTNKVKWRMLAEKCAY
jgi:hypothetical protein